MCSCSAAMRVGTTCSGMTTFVLTGARTICSVSASFMSFSDNGSTSQKVKLKSNGVWEIEQKLAYTLGSVPVSSGTMVKLICLRSVIGAAFLTVRHGIPVCKCSQVGPGVGLTISVLPHHPNDDPL